MAKRKVAAVEKPFGSVVTWSPSLLNNPTGKIPLKYTRIPKEQRTFLDTDEAWIRHQIPPSLRQHLQPPSRPEQEEGTPIPWSQSPPSHLRRPSQADQPSPSRLSTQHAESPVKARPVIPLRLAPALELPQSSPTVLESTIPQGSTESSGSGSELQARELLPLPLGPTPPSAQIIPCTASVPVTNTPAKRRWKDPETIFDSPVAQPTLRTKPRLPSSRPVKDSSPVYQYEPSDVIESLESDQPVVESAARQPDAERAPTTPSSALAIPEYEGSLGDFVRGVISLAELQRQEALPEFLFDDYVRIFSHDYINYVASTKDGEKVLTALKWYIRFVKQPMFTKNILSGENIQEVLRIYSDKVEEIQPSRRRRQSSWTTTVQPQEDQRRTSFIMEAPAPRTVTAIARVHDAELASDPISSAEGIPPRITRVITAEKNSEELNSFREPSRDNIAEMFPSFQDPYRRLKMTERARAYGRVLRESSPRRSTGNAPPFKPSMPSKTSAEGRQSFGGTNPAHSTPGPMQTQVDITLPGFTPSGLEGPSTLSPATALRGNINYPPGSLAERATVSPAASREAESDAGSFEGRKRAIDDINDPAERYEMEKEFFRECLVNGRLPLPKKSRKS
ncbi:hypothetical protein QBC35DRAFT_481435 [Podospora australis]|uniref:Uncharacterized protein n=1 Tax=Podospora australis TaxID=1536484 RepID=A0AAN7ALR0_9PEZI|nr:hypothetical protein QBC35DRAFT_481435 [Podospora australis]